MKRLVLLVGLVVLAMNTMAVDKEFDDILYSESKDAFDDSVTKAFGNMDAETENTVMFLINKSSYGMVCTLSIEGMLFIEDVQVVYRINKEKPVVVDATVIDYDCIAVNNKTDMAVLLGSMIELDEAGVEINLAIQVVDEYKTLCEVQMNGIAQAFEQSK